MKTCRPNRIRIFAALVFTCVSVQAYEFDRYQIILDRMPFGDTTVAPPPPPAPVAVNPNAPDWLKDYRLTMLTEEADGSLTLGLVNNRSKASVVLAEGDEDPVEGIRFLSGDYERIEVQIQKGSEIRTLSAKDNQAAASAPRPAARPKPATASPSSYAERRSARQKTLADLRKKQQEAQAAKPKYTPAEMQEHLQNYQMEVLRRGLPPLPVEISPEMENQLVDEGVLIVEPVQ